jgi:hypothetical protein
MPCGSIIAFDISILLRLARLDMLDRDVAALGPFQKIATDVFRAVIETNACRFAASSGLKSSRTLRSRKSCPSPSRSAIKSSLS